MNVARVFRTSLALRAIIANSVGTGMMPVPLLAATPVVRFQIEEATIEGIQSAILKGDLDASTQVVQLYLQAEIAGL